jgi:hypothetical protein
VSEHSRRALPWNHRGIKRARNRAKQFEKYLPNQTSNPALTRGRFSLAPTQPTPPIRDGGDSVADCSGEVRMAGQPGFIDLDLWIGGYMALSAQRAQGVASRASGSCCVAQPQAARCLPLQQAFEDESIQLGLDEGPQLCAGRLEPEQAAHLYDHLLR